MTRTLAVITLREISRRRGVLALMMMLPLAFYLVRRDLPGQSIRFLALGLGWATAALALFSSSASRTVDPRLRLAGYTVGRLMLGRLLATLCCGWALAAGYYVVTVVDQEVARSWAVAVMLIVTVAVAAPLGATIAALTARELEGALGLLTVVGVQMLADPSGRLAKLLPLWSTRSLGTYAIDATDRADLIAGLTHAAVIIALCLTITGAVLTRRLIVIDWPPPGPDPSR